MEYRDAIAEIAKEMEDDEARMGYGESAAQMRFALVLTFARQERNMTQQELADLLGVSRAYVVRLESGEANPSIAKAGRIFAALWLTPIEKPFPLLKGYGPYEPPRKYAAGELTPDVKSISGIAMTSIIMYPEMKYPDAIAEIAKEIEEDQERMGHGEAAAKIGFALALTFARQERNMTQQELADLLGVSRAYVIRLESGEANPSIAKAGRIFAALWLTPIEKPFPLLKGYGPYEPPRKYAAGNDVAAEPAPSATGLPADKAAAAGN